MPPAKRLEVAIGDKTLSLSNLEKVLYPRVGFTKGQVIDYYTRIAPVLLAHLRDRPLTIKRYPNGVEDKFFYEKRCPSHAPDVGADGVRLVGAQRGRHRLLPLPGPADAGVAGQPRRPRAAHAAGARAGDDHPTMIAFDLDPGPPADVVRVRAGGAGAAATRSTFCGLEAFPKTSGSKGMQVYLPLNTPATYEAHARVLARAWRSCSSGATRTTS